MALEIVHHEVDGDGDGDMRRRAAEERAYHALDGLLGRTRADAGLEPAPSAGIPGDGGDAGADEEIVDLRESGVSPANHEDAAALEWVTVADAADRAGVSTSTVRQWYRSGRLATQRRDGDRGAFLVPVSDVITLAARADEVGDAAEDLVLDINAGYWAAETEAARALAASAVAAEEEARTEARRLAADLEDARGDMASAREQLRRARADAAAAERLANELERETTFLRGQLEEAGQESLELRADVARAQQALDQARRSATFGSVISTAWVDEAEDGYRGPVRPQSPFADATTMVDAPEDHPAEEIVIDTEGGEHVRRPVIYGNAGDDLLPCHSAAKGRRRR